jgi:hypothetical protein
LKVKQRIPAGGSVGDGMNFELISRPDIQLIHEPAIKINVDALAHM